FKAGKLPLAQINVINLDAHTDFRPTEGRHSGNGFRYAEEDGYLQKYSVIGVKESYIQQNVWLDFVNNPFLDLISYEDIFLQEKRNFLQAVAHCTNFMDETFCGIELDLDVIEEVLSSACASSGITVMHARQYLNFVAQDLKPAYLHICEGAAQLSDGRKADNIGQLIAFLVTDFVKARQDIKIN
ncbi:arginase family protein, partial [Flavihumibacter sp. CACIAM 22H1]|uniref:arginase family protein n=1 Tax=Flavihumibacter sp. CACIAM 22H1 TaxID=1812911 RepID=UPI000B224DF6